MFNYWIIILLSYYKYAYNNIFIIINILIIKKLFAYISLEGLKGRIWELIKNPPKKS